jgi:serine/threonine protein kinase
MSSDSHPDSVNPKRPSPGESQASPSDDPGKTWVPDGREPQFLSETEDVPGPPTDTESGSFGSNAPHSEPPSQASQPAQTPEEPPRQFGEYELLERVGGGGMGNVYKAHHRGLDRVVALKTLRAGTAKSELQLERFLREAKAAARLDHPNIVPCYEFGKFSGWHFLTMAFVKGESLQDRLARGRIETREAASLVLVLAKAVAYAHHQGVIHRDIKPGNVILGEDGRPRLTDFGIAKLTSPLTTPVPMTQLTQVGQALGTPGYMAPEQSAGRRWEVGPSADIYGLGGVLVAALTGHHPGSHDSFETLAQNIPEHLQTICDRCLAYRPQDRFASADQLVEALELFLAGKSPAPASGDSSSKEQEPPDDSDAVITLPKSGLWKITGAVAAVLVCALLLGIWLGGWWKTSEPSNSPNPESPLTTQSNARTAVPAAPLQCRLDVFAGDGVEPPYPLDVPNSLPLHPQDHVFADGKVDREEKAFLYLVRVNTQGEAVLENEGKPIDLAPPDPTQSDAKQPPPFSVKAAFRDFVEIDREGPAGMLTVILLARAEPLSEKQLSEVRSALESLEAASQPAPKESTYQRFSFRNGRPHTSTAQETRNPLGDQHPVKVMLKDMVKQLGPHFEQIEAVSFAVPRSTSPP